jgi:3-deoxy-D-manno-octulosonate 8-phosphate phosphatase (KDO 8-P phosphatase)
VNATGAIPTALAERITPIKLAIFDVDGVLTDGSLIYGANGEELKVFNTLDGHGIKMLQASGVAIGIISGRQTQALARRSKDLGIEILYQGVADKGAQYAEVLAQLKLKQHEVASIGDDVVDLPILAHCGFSACVPAAPAFVRERVHYVTRAMGGHGAAREFCELIMRAQGTLDAALGKHLINKHLE